MVLAVDKASALSEWVDAFRLIELEKGFAPGAIEHIKKLTHYFGLRITPFWGYEIPLTEFPIEPDFLLCIDNPLRLFESLIDSAVAGPNKLRKLSSVYNRLLELTELWLVMPSKRINNIWLEYDYIDIQSTHPIPNFFYAPQQESIQEMVDLCDQIMQILQGSEYDNTAIGLLENCLNHLPPDAFVAQIGSMIARKDRHIRIYIQNLSPLQYLNYLTQIEYEFSHHPKLLLLFRELQTFTDSIDLDLDIYDRIGSKIGLELYFKQVTKAIACLEFMHHQGLCEPKTFSILRKHIENITIDRRNPYHHFFSHFKVVFNPHGKHAAKAYLAFVDQAHARKLIRIDHPLNPNHYDLKK